MGDGEEADARMSVRNRSRSRGVRASARHDRSVGRAAVAEGDDIDMAHPTAFGTLLKDFRRRAGLTQEALAECANVSSQTITKLERGVYRMPHKDTVHLLARALDLSPDERNGLLVCARQPTHPLQPWDEPASPTAPVLQLGAFVQAFSELHARQAAALALINVFVSACTDTDVRGQAAR